MSAQPAEDQYLHECLWRLQEEYAKAAKPFVDRLALIQSLRPPNPIFLPTAWRGFDLALGPDQHHEPSTIVPGRDNALLVARLRVARQHMRLNNSNLDTNYDTPDDMDALDEAIAVLAATEGDQ